MKITENSLYFILRDIDAPPQSEGFKSRVIFSPVVKMCPSFLEFGFEDVIQLVEADNWICETFYPVGPRPHSQMPSSSADAPPAPR